MTNNMPILIKSLTSNSNENVVTVRYYATSQVIALKILEKYNAGQGDTITAEMRKDILVTSNTINEYANINQPLLESLIIKWLEYFTHKLDTETMYSQLIRQTTIQETLGLYKYFSADELDLVNRMYSEYSIAVGNALSMLMKEVQI